MTFWKFALPPWRAMQPDRPYAKRRAPISGTASRSWPLPLKSAGSELNSSGRGANICDGFCRGRKLPPSSAARLTRARERDAAHNRSRRRPRAGTPRPCLKTLPTESRCLSSGLLQRSVRRITLRLLKSRRLRKRTLRYTNTGWRTHGDFYHDCEEPRTPQARGPRTIARIHPTNRDVCATRGYTFVTGH